MSTALAPAAGAYNGLQKMLEFLGSPRERLMLVKSVVLGTIFILSALLPAQAQVTVDVTKINCDQFVHHKITESRSGKFLSLMNRM